MVGPDYFKDEEPFFVRALKILGAKDIEVSEEGVSATFTNIEEPLTPQATEGE
jgi:hypothetical protein